MSSPLVLIAAILAVLFSLSFTCIAIIGLTITLIKGLFRIIVSVFDRKSIENMPDYSLIFQS